MKPLQKCRQCQSGAERGGVHVFDWGPTPCDARHMARVGRECDGGHMARVNLGVTDGTPDM